MATNLDSLTPIRVACSHPATPSSGDPVRFGVLPGVALDDEDSGGDTTVDIRARVYDLTVDDNAGTGISPGDTIYYHDTGTGTPTTSLNNSATAADAVFGISLGTVATNATTSIRVLVIPTATVA